MGKDDLLYYLKWTALVFCVFAIVFELLSFLTLRSKIGKFKTVSFYQNHILKYGSFEKKSEYLSNIDLLQQFIDDTFDRKTVHKSLADQKKKILSSFRYFLKDHGENILLTHVFSDSTQDGEYLFFDLKIEFLCTIKVFIEMVFRMEKELNGAFVKEFHLQSQSEQRVQGVLILDFFSKKMDHS